MRQTEINTYADLDRAMRAATTTQELQNLTVYGREHGLFPGTETAQPATPAKEPEERVFEKDITVNGRTITLVASSAAELERREQEALEVAAALQPTVEDHVQRIRESALSPQDEADLRLSFLRGEITPAQYIERTKIVEKRLAELGIDVDALRTESARGETQSWAEAVETVKSPGGALENWPGGQRNLAAIGTALQALHLENTEDKVGALEQAYQYLVDHQMLHGPDAPQIDPRATPQEILEEWKIANGGDENSCNDQFLRTFSKTGSGSSLFGGR